MPACPFCAEKIPASATTCPHCGMDTRPPRTGVGAPRNSPPPAQKSSSSTLIIVLGVAAGLLLMCVVGLVALLLPAVQAARTAARDTQSRNNLKQIGLALHNYHDQHTVFPPGGVFDESGTGLHGWQTLLLPYVDQAPLYAMIQQDVPWDDPANRTAFTQILPTYLHPAVEEKQDASGYALSHYAANSLVFGRNDGLPIREVTDGTSNTIMAGDAAGDYKAWGHPENWRDPTAGINTGPNSFGRPGTERFMILLMDGSVRTVDASIDPNVLKALGTPNGGEAIPVF